MAVFPKNLQLIGCELESATIFQPLPVSARCLAVLLRIYRNDNKRWSEDVRMSAVIDHVIWVYVAGLLLESHRDPTNVCCGLEQLGLCVQRPGRDLACHSSFREGELALVMFVV